MDVSKNVYWILQGPVVLVSDRRKCSYGVPFWFLTAIVFEIVSGLKNDNGRLAAFASIPLRNLLFFQVVSFVIHFPTMGAT